MRPTDFLSKAYGGRELPAGTRLTIQVAPDDCTGCGICVDVCPARSKSEAKHKAIDLLPAIEHRDVERVRYDFFLGIPEIDRSAVRHDTVKGSQLLQPLFEFSGACSGCGETPYLKLLSQQFGDRMVVANATGCSSIYGGNLPTTPWASDAARAAGRPGATRCSRTTRSSGWACGSAPTRSATRPDGCWPRWRTRSAATWPARSSRTSPDPRTRRASPGSASWSCSCATRLAGRTDERAPSPRQPRGRARARSPCGSSAATAGRTTSASAASTTSCPAAATSTSWCSTPRCTPTPAARRRSRRRARRRPSSPATARPPARRTSACSPRPTATCTWPRSRWGPTRRRRCARCARPWRTTDRAWSSRTRRASRTASRCRPR